tara:strand:- start:6790 stop:7491 length:702 start_codon:yes stop_codon:yes gene_type:complete
MTEADIKKQKPNLEDLNIIKKVNFYDKKVNIYIIKITIEILLVCVFVAVFFLFQKIEKDYEVEHKKEIKVINSNITRLQKDTKNIEGKVAEVKTFKERWDNSSVDLMGLKEIKSNYLKDRINSVAKKYKIHDLKITEYNKNKANIKSLNLQKLYLDSVGGAIKFSVMTDIDGIDFIGDIISDLAGYFIISKLSITKKKDKYLSKEILKIKNKEYDQFIIYFEIDYTWYVIKRN